MKKSSLLILLVTWSVHLCISQGHHAPIRISRDIEVIPLSQHTYMHVSYADIPPWGRVASNGLLFVSDGEAFLFDTPTTDSLTNTLIDWITDSLKVRIVGFVPNHWHADCMGGLGYVNAIGIPSYAQERTISIAKLKKLPCPRYPFADSLSLPVGGQVVVCRYFGCGHTVDNIVSWIPSERVLFGGCMVKDMKSETLGNTTDADLAAWPGTIHRVVAAYGDAQFVVPGHGAFGGIELLTHTQALLLKSK